MTTFMEAALEEARKAAGRGEVPVGAALVRDAQIIAADGNRMRALSDPTAHAEILVLRAGGHRLGTERLSNCDLYVTLEPCTMCAGAISLARIRRLYYGAYDAKGGAVANGPRFFSLPACHHRPEVYDNIDAEPSTLLLREFFSARRRR